MPVAVLNFVLWSFDIVSDLAPIAIGVGFRI